MKSNRYFLGTTSAVCALLLAGSALAVSPKDLAYATKVLTQVAKLLDKYPDIELEVPESLPDASGKYVSPYQRDGGMSAWAEKSLSAEAGEAAGEAAGESAGNVVAAKVPFGGFMKGAIKDKSGQAGAVAAVGGWDFIRESSDISYDDVEDYSVYLHATHGMDADYKESLATAFSVYPELKKKYKKSLDKAYKAAKKKKKAGR